MREQFIYMKIADDPTPLQRDMRVSGVMSVLGYGVIPDFALFGMLPWFDKWLDMTMGEQDLTHRTSFVLVIADFALWPFHPIIATFHFLRAIFLSCLAFVNRAEVRKGHNPHHYLSMSYARTNQAVDF